MKSARFIWKSIPSSIKEIQLEVTVRSSGYVTMLVNEAIRGFDWSQDVQGLVASFSEVYTKEIVSAAYSTISIKDTALFLRMIEDDATNSVLQQGWTVDPASHKLIVKKQHVVTPQNLDHSKLQGLTEYVFHHEHRGF